MSPSRVLSAVSDLLAELVRIPSVNPTLDPTGQGEARIAAFIAEWLHEIGVTVNVVKVEPGRPNVLAILDSRRPGAHLLFETHMDTVQVSNMTVDPYSAARENGRIIGRGACDAKGPLAAMLWAMADLSQHSTEFSGSLTLAAVMDEEMHAKGVEALIASGLRWDAAVVGEPTQLRVVTCHKGGVSFRIRCKGRAAHSSAPELGVNAIYRMADVLHLIRDQIVPSYVNRHHPLLGSPTISVGKIWGGREVFTVADECVIEVNRRLLPGEDSGMVMAEIRGVLSKLPLVRGEAQVEVEAPFFENYPVETPATAPIVVASRKAAQTLGLDDRITGVQFGSDAGRLFREGVPCILFGPGDISCAHTAHEWIEVEDLERGAKAYRILAETYLCPR